MIRTFLASALLALIPTATASAQKTPQPNAAIYVCNLTAHRICSRESCRKGPAIVETFRLDLGKQLACRIVKDKCSGGRKIMITSDRRSHRIEFPKALAVMLLQDDGTLIATRLQRKSVIMSFGSCKQG